MQESLITSIQQQQLFDAMCDGDTGEELLFLKERKASTGNNTGERIAKDEDTYRQIVSCLAEGMSLRKTAKMATALRGGKSVSKNTVAAIRDREGLAIGTQKKVIAQRLKDFAEASSERMLEEVDALPVGQLPVALAIAIDKFQLLDGEPTAITATVHSTDFSIDDFIESLPAADAVSTGVVAGEKGEKEGGMGLPDGLTSDDKE